MSRAAQNTTPLLSLLPSDHLYTGKNRNRTKRVDTNHISASGLDLNVIMSRISDQEKSTGRLISGLKAYLRENVTHVNAE